MGPQLGGFHDAEKRWGSVALDRSSFSNQIYIHIYNCIYVLYSYICSYNSLEEQLRSDVQLSERLASLRPTQHYRTERFKGGPEMVPGPLYIFSIAAIIFFIKYFSVSSAGARHYAPITYLAYAKCSELPISWPRLGQTYVQIELALFRH